MSNKATTFETISDVPIVIHHSLKGAVFFSVLVISIATAIIAMALYLKSQGVYGSVPIPFIVITTVIFIALLHVVKCLLLDAGKVAISIARDGVKFNRYDLITWADIEDVYIVEDSDGPAHLWLSVKEGVTFLPEEPRPLVWLAKKTGLHQNIDITGYGELSMKDNEIRRLLEQGIQQFGRSH